MNKYPVISLCIIFTLCLLSGCADTIERGITEISVYKTNGNPLKSYSPPAEQITVKKLNREYIMLIETKEPGSIEEELLKEKINLSPNEWVSILKVIKDKKLLSWQTKISSDNQFDYGCFGFSIAGKQNNTQYWNKSIPGFSAPEELKKHISSLAERKIKNLKLFYLGH